MKLKCLLISIMAVSACKAQMVITSRGSQFGIDWLYGYAGDVRTGDDTNASGALLPLDTIGLFGSSTGDGYYPPTDHHWSATVTWDMVHTYNVSGSLTNAYKIESSGSSAVTSNQSGATSNINGASPGGELAFDFVVPRTWDFHIYGWLEQNGPLHRNSASVYIYKSDGAGGWIIFFIAPVQNAIFDTTKTFPAGTYRIITGAGCMATGDESTHAAWNCTLVAACLPCDLNCDGSVNPFDIQPFIDLLGTGGAGGCSPCAGDTTLDGTVNPFDINGFIDCLD